MNMTVKERYLLPVRSIVIGLLLVLIMPAGAAALPTEVYAAEAFSETAQDVTDHITAGWNLGNSLDSYEKTKNTFGAADLSSETAWGNPPITRELIASVAESGFNTVRLPVTWYTHMDPETYAIDPAWMARVREVVDFILDEDMYCILNVHHDTGVDGWLIASEEDLPRKKEILTSIWEQLCEEFGDYGDRLIFEGYNEILDENKTWDTPGEEGIIVANELNQLFVDVVRASGGNNAKRILYVNTYCASCHELSLNAFVMPEDPAGDDRIIAGVHVYRPYDFTHEDFPKIREWTESDINIALNDVRDRFAELGVPALIGEFGCADKNNDEERITWANYFMRTATACGLKAVWWDEGNRYKLYNRYTGKITEPEITEAVIAGARGEVYTPGSKLARTFYRLKEDFGMFLQRSSQYRSIRSWFLIAAGSALLILLAVLAGKQYGKRRRRKYPVYDDLFPEENPRVYRLWARLLILVSAFFTLMYLTWRVCFSVPVGNGIAAVAINLILLVVEIIGFFETLVHYANILATREHPLPVIEENEYPDVDIFIATYNESTDLLRLTINGCKHLEYPDLSKVHIWVCDDNRRPAMRALAESMGVGYFDRPDNKGAKAGNLNHAMGLTKAPYIVTLDADMIVKSDFLMKTIPYFVDAKKRAAQPGKEHIKLGFIQTPQCFYDPDVFQHALYSEFRAPNEQNFFYQSIEPARTATNSVIYGGSNTILAREALEKIGGFYTESITEDFATGLLIEDAGYVSLGLPEPLASGRTPHTFREHIKQRIRWARGVIVTAGKLRLFRRRGLSFYQKMSYWGSVAYWYLPIKNLVYALSPLFYAVLGIIVFRCHLADILLYWLTAFLLQDICLIMISRRSVSSKWSGIYEISVMPFMLVPVIKESLGISLSKFQVTDKSGAGTKRVRDVRAMMPFIVLILLSVVGIVRVVMTLSRAGFLNSAIILFWLVRNLYFYIMAMFLIDGRDSDEEPVKVVDAELLALKSSRDGTVYEGVTSRMYEHSVTAFLDQGGLRIGDFVDITVDGGTASANMTGVVIAVKNLRYSEGSTVTVEIIDFKEDELEYMQILFDRIPSLPQSLTLRDFGIVSHLWHNIVVRLSRTV